MLRRELAKMIYKDVSQQGRMTKVLERRKIGQNDTDVYARKEIESDIYHHRMSFYDMQELSYLSPRDARKLRDVRNEVEMDIRTRTKTPEVETPLTSVTEIQTRKVPEIESPGSPPSWALLKMFQDQEKKKNRESVRFAAPNYPSSFASQVISTRQNQYGRTRNAFRS
ncbi:hypothetical protein R1flu_017014 [Riccia fluitans]|uniref:Uncharacterized protein n=1 Tax=Riccia fluitans TaxID=41844 RepID=A0ABD1YNH1_9MARC